MNRSWGYGSERGLRKDNDDAFGVFQFTDFTLAVICDGVGGSSSGRHAAKLAVRTVHDTLEISTATSVEAALREAVSQANSAIFDESRRNHRLTGMGTTIVMVAVTDDEAYIAHVGDSRAYLVKEGAVQQVTSDHTMVNLFVESGLLSPEEAQTHPEANVLSRVVGIERSVDLDVSAPIKLDEGDVLLVCSDGVHSVLTDWEFGNVDWDMPQAGVQQALEMIAEREANDNATLVAIMMGQCDENISLTTPPEISSEASATLTPAAAGRAEQPPPSPPVTDEPAGQPWQYSDDSTTSDTAPAISKNTDAPPPPPGSRRRTGGSRAASPQ